ncbi:MAG TPA: hypothetical protein VGQ83_39635, partial [Polyangia bacterium]
MTPRTLILAVALLAPALMLVTTLAPRAAAAEPARKMKPAARRHLDRGMSHYQKRDFDRAIEELKKGKAIDPRPEFLYALGQVYRASGDCSAAVQHYEEFLATEPPEAQAAAARNNVERCRQLLAPVAPLPALAPAPREPAPPPAAQAPVEATP